MADKKSKLVVIDAPAVLYRGWHALPKLKDPKGRTINAVYGFSALLLKLLKEQKPDYIAAAFDTPAPTFRHKKYKEYKATRVPQPQEFYDQIPITKKVIKSFNIPVLTRDGFEADDLIATIIKNQKAKIKNLNSIIVTGDLDLLQLVDDRTSVYFLKQGVKNIKMYDSNAIHARFNLLPSQLIDYKALVGDPSDNIPGARGIGPKTATELIKKFNTIENIYKYIEKNKGSAKTIKESIVQTLINHKKDVLLAKKLVTIKHNVAGVALFPKNTAYKLDAEKIIPVFENLGFKSLIQRLEKNNIEQQKLLL